MAQDQVSRFGRLAIVYSSCHIVPNSNVCIQIKESESSGAFSCPCCLRDMVTTDEMKAFTDQLKKLGGMESILLKADERNKTARSLYQNWRKVVSENMDDVLDYRRICKETTNLDKNISDLDKSLQQLSDELNQATDTKNNLQAESDEVRQLLEDAKRWAENASRIATKRLQVNDKQISLSVTSGDLHGRDMQTVETDLEERMEAKEKHSNMVRTAPLVVWITWRIALVAIMFLTTRLPRPINDRSTN